MDYDLISHSQFKLFCWKPLSSENLVIFVSCLFFFFFFYRHLPCFVCTGIRSSWQGTLRWFQETVCVWWLPVADGYRTTPESKEEPGPGVGRGIMRKQSTWVWQARGESSRKLKPEEGRRNSGWNHSRAVESRRAPWEIVDLVRGPETKLIPALQAWEWGRVEQPLWCQVAMRRALFIVTWEFHVKFSQQGPCFP